MGLLDDEPIETTPKKHFRATEAQANRLLKVKKIRRGKRKKNKRKIPKMSYKQYMGSAYWMKRKLLYWSKHGKSCAVCQKKEGVTLHHKRYDVKYGDEPDDALVPLCQFHHQGFHESNKLKRNMVKATDNYVAEASHTHKQFIESNIDDLSWIQ
jgi:hypothetical protein